MLNATAPCCVLQEAYINGYWKELAGFTRSMFNSTFKSNPYLERAIKEVFKALDEQGLPLIEGV